MPNLDKKPSLAGIQRRRGIRSPKFLTYSYDQCATKAFDIIGVVIKDAQREWNDLSLDMKIKVGQFVQPLALKRIPDKHEVVQISLNATDEEMRKLLALAQGNLLARQQPTSHVVSVVAKVVEDKKQDIAPLIKIDQQQSDAGSD